jgi:hypothetical protein
LNGGKLVILPGTAIGYRMDYVPSLGHYTYIGFDVWQNSTVVSEGTPDKPNVFVDAQLVQEQWMWAAAAGFVPDFYPVDENSQPPLLDFRFSKFYANYTPYSTAPENHIWSGLDTWELSAWSLDSVMNLSLRDCAFRGGGIEIGLDYDYTDSQCPSWGAGAMTWVNNAFDDTAISVEPTAYEECGWGMHVDLAFFATNNLFKGGPWFHLEPIPASAGNWTLMDNFFDQADIMQDVDCGSGIIQPLDFSHNGYWPLSTNELRWDNYMSPWSWVPTTQQLQPTATSDGSSEVTLSQPPPYQSGPFGKFYLPNTTPLYGAGSTNAAGLGLYHYTTRIDQVKEGNDTAKANANIGLHYVAANNYGQPLDSDGDGIPDYVEDANGNGQVDANETDWRTQYTALGIWDPTNSVYDDLDLSGNGFVGRIKKALGMNPFDTSNPLTLTQVFTGEEPDVVAFEVPISYNVLTNIGILNLNISGIGAKLDECVPANDGNALLIWNTDYDAPGQDYLQPQLTLDTFNDTIAIAVGPITPFDSGNVLQFFESDSLFDTNGAYLDAQMPAQYVGQNVTYTIQINDPSTTPPTPVKTITGSTSSGMIQENWDATYNDNVTKFTGDTLTAVFNVTLPDQTSSMRTKISAASSDQTSSTRTKTLTKLVATEQGTTGKAQNFDFIYMYTPPNNLLAFDFGDYYGNPGNVWLGMLDPVDTLLTPQTVSGGSPNNYDSTFNTYDSEDFPGEIGDPGYCDSRYEITNSTVGLYPNLANGATRNFYCHAHGNHTRMASYTPDARTAPAAYIDCLEVGNALSNHWYALNVSSGGLHQLNPYRFVFLDGCSTESVPWQRAFGIMPYWAGTAARTYGLGPQAFVGWATTNSDWLGGAYTTNGTLIYDDSVDSAWSYARTLGNNFYYQWIRGVPLASCIYNASNPTDGSCPLTVPQYQNQTVTLSGIGPWGSYNHTSKITYTSQIYVVGHSGLTRYRYDASQDNIYHDPNDHP